MAADPAPIDGDVLAEHTERMRGLARGLLRDYDRAEDVVQETALKALTGRVRPRTTLGACLSGVVRNVAYKLRRSERRRSSHEAGAAREPRVPSTADLLARLDEQRRVLDAVRELPEPFRSTILLRYIDGLPPRQIAARQDVPVETVKSRIKRGLARLRERLDDGHGGSRKAWLAALFPVAGWGHLLGASTTTAATAATTGGLMTASHKTSIAALVLLIGGVAVWFATDGFGALTTEDTTTTTTASTEGGLEAGPTLEGREGGLGADAPERPTPDETPSDVVTQKQPTDENTPVTTTPSTGRSPSTLPPVRHSPFAPPPPKKGRPDVSTAKFGGGGGGMGPTGHWTRFRLAPPPKGTARLRVKVTDEAGIPIESAKVYLGPEDVANQPAVSYGSLRNLGKTDRAGRYEHRELTPGTVVVCANIGALLTRRYGLDTRSGQVITLKNGDTVDATIKLPLSAKDLGTIEGRVTDPHDRPIRAVRVTVGRNVVNTDKDGRYRLLRVPAGKQHVAFTSWGWKPKTEELEIRAGGTTKRDVVLEFGEKGTVTVRGTVVGPQGEPVKGCYVYFNVKGDNATLRDVNTDAEGRFEFKDLPERITKEAVEVQGAGFPKYGSTRVPFPEGIADGKDVRIKIEQRFIDVVLEVKDAATGEPVQRTRIKAKRLEGEMKHGGLFWYREEKGGHDGMLEPGRYRVTVEALDHQDVEFDLDVPYEEGFRYPVRLARTSPDSVDVHLTIDIYSGAGEDPVTKAKVEILDASGEPLTRFDGRRAEGRYLVPAPSGKRILRITADGHEPYEESLTLDPKVLELTHSVHLRSK